VSCGNNNNNNNNTWQFLLAVLYLSEFPRMEANTEEGLGWDSERNSCPLTRQHTLPLRRGQPDRWWQASSAGVNTQGINSRLQGSRSPRDTGIKPNSGEGKEPTARLLRADRQLTRLLWLGRGMSWERKITFLEGGLKVEWKSNSVQRWLEDSENDLREPKSKIGRKTWNKIN
jgi:hypothetical protein